MTGANDFGRQSSWQSAPDPRDPGPQYWLDAEDRGGGAIIGDKPSFDAAEAGAHITRTNVFWGPGLGSAAVVTFAFRATAPTTMPLDTAGFSPFTAAQITVTLSVLAAWSDVANITFVRVDNGSGYSNNATMLFGNYSSGAPGAWAFGFAPPNPNPNSISGDVWFNSTIEGALAPEAFSFNYNLMVHEIGHALGLSHPGTYDVLNGEPLSYAADAEYYEDSAQYSVMSYFGAANTGANHGGMYSAAPLLDDIVAIQRLYGANTTTRTGDTTYGFNSTAGQSWFSATEPGSPLIFAVWDAGGTDTLDFSGYSQNQVINLRQGAFSSVGALVGNVAIAIGATIENAIGGSGHDSVRGNASNNLLRGGAGDDMIDGGAGNDVLDGGAGEDKMYGGVGADTYVFDDKGDRAYEGAGGGIDLVRTRVTYSLQANIENLTMFGTGAIGAIGNALNNRIIGNEGDNVIKGGLGADRLEGGKGDDNYLANKEDQLIELANGGIDTVRTSDSWTLGTHFENLTLIGSSNTFGGGNAKANIITGNSGNNVIYGGGLGDTLKGGDGVDRFVYTAASDSTAANADRILDLRGNEIIDLRGVDANTSVAGDQAFVIVDAFTNVAGQMTVTYDAASQTSTARMDINGDGVADMAIIMNGDKEDFAGWWL